MCARVSGILWRQTNAVLFPSSIAVQAVWLSLKSKSLENQSCHFAEVIVVKEMFTNYLLHTLHPASYCACCKCPWTGKWVKPGQAGTSPTVESSCSGCKGGSYPAWLKWGRIRAPRGVKAPHGRWEEETEEEALCLLCASICCGCSCALELQGCHGREHSLP